MLLWVFTAIDHRKRQNTVMTSVTHTTALRMPLFCSCHVFTILRDLLRNKRMESINLGTWKCIR